MRRIPLTKGKYALVDDCDYEYLMQWNWCCHSQGYACRTYCPEGRNGPHNCILMHRVIAERMGLDMSCDTDHKHRNKLDNRRCELRAATNQQQAANHGIQKNNTSGFRGVHWYKSRNQWSACIKVGGKQIHLGYYRTGEEAAKVYNTAASHHFGEFAYLNPI